MIEENDGDDIVRKLLEERSAEVRRCASEVVGSDQSSLEADTNKEVDSYHQVVSESGRTEGLGAVKETGKGGQQERTETLLGPPCTSLVHASVHTWQVSVPGAHAIYVERPNMLVSSEGGESNHAVNITLPPAVCEEDGCSVHSLSERTGETCTQPSMDASSFRNLVSAMLVSAEEGEERGLPHADPVDHSARHSKRRRSFRWLLCGLASILMIIVGVIVVVILFVALEDASSSSGNLTPEEEVLQKPGNPTPEEEVLQIPEDYLRSLLPSATLNSIAVHPDSPQSMAFQWLKQDPFLFTGNYTGTTEWRLLQRFALASLYFATGGDNWIVNSHWLSYHHHECDWSFQHSIFYEIPQLTVGLAVESACNDNGVYTDLRLSRNALKGRLPMETSLLSSLQTIDLSFNAFSGTLPNFESLSNLKVFAAGSNAFTGSIPHSLFQPSLSALVLYGNDLSGTLSSSIGALTSLQLLAIGSNRLSGSVPTEVGKLTKLISFNVEFNSMTGTIPTELGLLSSIFNDIYFRGNPISGTIPTEIGNLSDLKYASLGESKLTGTIPSEVGRLVNVEKFYLQDNLLTGTVPAQLGHMTTLRRLKLQDNDLSGTVPLELVTLPELQYINLKGNSLISGEIPSELCWVEDTFDGLFDCSACLCGCDCPCSP